MRDEDAKISEELIVGVVDKQKPAGEDNLYGYIPPAERKTQGNNKTSDAKKIKNKVD